MNMRNSSLSLILIMMLLIFNGASFGNEQQRRRAPDGDFSSIDARYENLIAESQRAGYSDPINFVVSRLDTTGLKLLLDNGHALHLQGYRLPLEIAVDDYVRSQEIDRPAHRSFIEAMLQLGANPGQKGGEAVRAAIGADAVDLAILLLNYSRGSLYKISVYEEIIGARLENDEALAKAFLNANRAIPRLVVSLALKGGIPRLWKAAVESRLPLEADTLFWINGNFSILDIEDMQNLSQFDAVKAHLDSVGKRFPATGEDVHLRAYYPSDQITLLLTAEGPYSAAFKNNFLAYATNLCLHRLGEPCGSDESIRQAEKWLDHTKVNCTGDEARYFDQWLCKLATIYVERKPIDIGVFFKEANSPDDVYSGLEAFCHLGQHSIRRGAEPLKALQKDCSPI